MRNLFREKIFNNLKNSFSFLVCNIFIFSEKVKMPGNKKLIKKVNNTVIKKEKLSSNEEENEEEEDEIDEEDDQDEEKEDNEESKSRKNSESSDAKFNPAMLGLLRVGDDFPKKEKKEPIMLNRRGMVSVNIFIIFINLLFSLFYIFFFFFFF